MEQADISNLRTKKEGTVTFYTFDPERFSDSGMTLKKNMPVFYNPIQELNRSISLIAFLTFQTTNIDEKQENYYVCDCMAASGIRTLRLKQFLKQGTIFIVNDLNPLALEMIKHNAKLNTITLDDSIQIHNKDANYLFQYLRHEKQLPSIIDIDPFGSPNIFVENALYALRKNGLLALTATDTAVFFGVRKEACVKKYNSKPLRSTFLKEVGLRILLYFTATRAHPLNKAIHPLISLSFNHYVRLFIQIESGLEKVNQNLRNFGYILWCPHCDWRDSVSMNIFQIPQTCPQCHQRIQYGGPMWIGKLHDTEFIEQCQKNCEDVPKEVIPSKKKILKVLDMIRTEDKYPLGYYEIHKICDKLNISVVSRKLILKTIEEHGYSGQETHINPRAIKTDMPLEELKEILIQLAKDI